ncbi:MAG: OmpH family outer membrane protein [Anaeromyxobacter sp.]
MRLTARLSLAALALAAALPAAAQTKIGVVDVNKVLNESEQGKAAQASFRKEVEDRQKQIAVIESDLEKEKADLEKQASILTESAMRDRQGTLQKKFESYQQQAAKLSQELNDIRGKLLAPIGDRVKGVIREVAQAESLDLVIDVTAGVAYYNDAMDVTSQVLRRYNAKFPAPAAAAPAKKADAKPAAPAKK